MKSTDHFQQAQEYIRRAKESQNQGDYGPALDNASRSIHESLTGGIHQERERGNPHIHPQGKMDDTIDTARNGKIISDDLSKKAKGILAKTPLPYDKSILQQTAADAIETAEKILGEVQNKQP
jgi:HEPN domain-containing protein